MAYKKGNILFLLNSFPSILEALYRALNTLLNCSVSGDMTLLHILILPPLPCAIHQKYDLQIRPARILDLAVTGIRLRRLIPQKDKSHRIYQIEAYRRTTNVPLARYT